MLNMVYIAQTGETGLMCYKIWKAGTLLKKVGDFSVPPPPKPGCH
jgi:hypothetical protein